MNEPGATAQEAAAASDRWRAWQAKGVREDRVRERRATWLLAAVVLGAVGWLVVASL